MAVTPGRVGQARLIQHTLGQRVLASCPPCFGDGDSLPGSINIVIEDGPANLCADVANGEGVYPTVYGSPGISTPVSKLSPTTYRAWFGAVNAGNCPSGQPAEGGLVRSHQVRLRRVTVDAYVVEAFVLTRSQTGECAYVQYFYGGGVDFAAIRRGEVVTIVNRATCGSEKMPRLFYSGAAYAILRPLS